MEDCCEQAGCDDKQRKQHVWKWERKGWHSHPFPSFVAWWEPSGTDPESGASVGGHPDARRVWARKDPGRWLRRRYGIPTESAWNIARYVIEFSSWQEAGSPEPDFPFISLAASLGEQATYWGELKPILERIGAAKKPERLLLEGRK